jgi:hypothetical protein
MTSLTQLFKMVTANDYEGLSRLLNSKKPAEINSYKSGHSLISKAIEVRAKECFDIILEHPNNTMLKNKNSGFNGLSKAIEYYSLAPNPTNEYYVQRLLEKGVPIDTNIICKVIDDINMFQLLLARMIHDQENLSPIIFNTIKTNKIEVFKLIYDKILGINLNQQNMSTLNSKIFEHAFINSNLEVLELIKDEVNCKIIKYNQRDTPVIYQALINKNKIVFDYFYSKYEQLSKEDINSIPNIKNINDIFVFGNLEELTEKNYEIIKEGLDKIFKLPIEFNDVALSVGKIMEKMFTPVYYSWNFNRYHQSWIVSKRLIYWLLKTNKIKSNPFEAALLSQIDTNFKTTETRLRNNPERIQSFRYQFQHVLFLLGHFNYEPNQTIKEKFLSIIGKEILANSDTEKKAYIDSLESSYNVVKKSKKVSTKVKKVAKPNADLEV